MIVRDCLLFKKKAITVLLCLFALMMGQTWAGELPSSGNNVSLMAKNQDIKLFLKNLFSMAGNPVNIPDDIEGTVNKTFVDQPVGVVFDQVSKSHSLLGYYDGVKVHIYNNNAIQRRVLPVNRGVGQTVVSNARKMGLVDRNNTVKLVGSGSLVVTGVERFFEQIKELVRAGKARPSVPATRTASTQSIPVAASGFKVFYLKYAWAEDVTLYLGGRDVIIPGVASTLKQLLGIPYGPPGPRVIRRPSATVPSLKGQGLAADEIPQQSVVPSPPPIVQNGEVSIAADSRLNAVIVRDNVANLPQYQSLIEALDIKPEMVEIEATIIDVNVDRMRDLGIDWTASRGQVGEGSGTQLEAGFSSILGGFTSYMTGNRNRFIGQLNALEKKGALNVVSSPHILTLSNVEAVFDVNSTFFVRLEGQEEVDLFNVSAGTSLRVTPHVFNDQDETQIKLMVAIQDGRQNEQRVDDIPTITRSTISTQALIGPDESMLIGGLAQEAYTQDDKQVPSVSRVPVFGNLFKAKNNGRERIERMFLISPRLTSQYRQTDGRIESVRDRQWQQIAGGDYRDLKKAGKQTDEKTRKPLASLSNIDPVEEVVPNYPTEAFLAGTEGRCSVRFSIDTRGKPKDIEVDTCSNSVFIQASKAAIADFRYLPQTQGGNPLEVAQQTRTFVFEIH